MFFFILKITMAVFLLKLVKTLLILFLVLSLTFYMSTLQTFFIIKLFIRKNNLKPFFLGTLKRKVYFKSNAVQ